MRSLAGVVLCLPLALSACFVQPPAPVFVRDVGSGNTAAIAAASGAEARPQALAMRPAAIAPAVSPAPILAPEQKKARRPTGPMPQRPLNVATRCSFRDETGVQGSLNLEVAEDSVRRFAADVTMPRRGACHFDLAQFQQTEKTPNAVLAARDNDCQVLFWQQDEQVTIAFNACEAQCTGDAFNYLWPIFADARTGSCS